MLLAKKFTSMYGKKYYSVITVALNGVLTSETVHSMVGGTKLYQCSSDIRSMEKMLLSFVITIITDCASS